MLTRKLCREIDTLDTMECEAMELLDALAELSDDAAMRTARSQIAELHTLIFEMVDKTNDIMSLARDIHSIPLLRISQISDETWHRLSRSSEEVTG